MQKLLSHKISLSFPSSIIYSAAPNRSLIEHPNVFEHYWLNSSPYSQKWIILHVSRTYLYYVNEVNLIKKWWMHYLGYDIYSSNFLSFFKPFKTIFSCFCIFFRSIWKVNGLNALPLEINILRFKKLSNF